MRSAAETKLARVEGLSFGIRDFANEGCRKNISGFDKHGVWL
jgi:hypothetical protein